MRIFASQAFPSGVDPETFQFMLRALKEAATPEMQEKLETVLFDNRDYLARVSVPTLVLHRRGDQLVPFAAGQYLARKLPNAQFVPLDGDCHLPNFGDVDSVLAPILKFLAEDDAQEHDASRSQETAQTVAALPSSSSPTSSTRPRSRSAWATPRSAPRSRALDDGVRAAIRDAGGTPVEGKVLGDGVMGVFTSAPQAIAAARRCVARVDGASCDLHLGLHAGDVIREDDNVYGGAVNIASRICGLCEPGEILVSGDGARAGAHVGWRDVRGSRRADAQGDRRSRAGVRGAPGSE